MTGWDISLLVLALIASAIYSGLETGIISVNPLRLEHVLRQKLPRAKRIARYVNEPDLLLGTTLVGTNLCNVALSVMSAHVAVALLPQGGLWVASLVSTLTLLIFGEYLPKAWFRSNPVYRVMPFATFMHLSSILFYPLRVGVMQIARLLVHGPGDATAPVTPIVTREELSFLASEGEKTGELSAAERRMMQGVLTLSHQTCADIMVPRAQMVIVRPKTPATEILDLARMQSMSRLPIYDEQAKTYTGFVNVMDLLLTPDDLESRTAQDFARPPQYASADSRIDQLLPRMRLSHQPLALIQDEREQVIGLVSVEDILEEIVGELGPITPSAGAM